MAFKIALPVLVMALAPLSASLASANDAIAPPTISVDQLGSAVDLDLHQLLHHSHGILRISVGGDFSDLRKRALAHLCDCPTFDISDREALRNHPSDLQQIDLPDGTVRRTLASATVGFGKQHQQSETVLELPSWAEDACGQEAYDAFEYLRGATADVVNSFVKQLDVEKKQMYGVDEEDMDQSYQQILSDVTHLEHFHVYIKSMNSDGGNKDGDVSQSNGGDHARVHGKKSPTLDYHTDAGFFLSFVPAMNCHSYTTDNSSFFLKGQEEAVKFDEDEVVIMMGAGAQHWLPTNEKVNIKDYPFLAASHALHLEQGAHRTWYGKMHLLPSSFTSTNTDENLEHSVTQINRGLQEHSAPSDCNNQTNFFCWNQCMDVPSSENADQDGYTLYCLDPAILASSSSVPDAAAPCMGGFVHNKNCTGSWQETDDSVPVYDSMHSGEEHGEKDDHSDVEQGEHEHEHEHEHDDKKDEHDGSSPGIHLLPAKLAGAFLLFLVVCLV